MTSVLLVESIHSSGVLPATTVPLRAYFPSNILSYRVSPHATEVLRLASTYVKPSECFCAETSGFHGGGLSVGTSNPPRIPNVAVSIHAYEAWSHFLNDDIVRRFDWVLSQNNAIACVSVPNNVSAAGPLLSDCWHTLNVGNTEGHHSNRLTTVEQPGRPRTHIVANGPTSYACARVAAVALAIAERAPGQLGKCHIMATADSVLTDSGQLNSHFGAGRLNASRALTSPVISLDEPRVLKAQLGESLRIKVVATSLRQIDASRDFQSFSKATLPITTAPQITLNSELFAATLGNTTIVDKTFEGPIEVMVEVSRHSTAALSFTVTSTETWVPRSEVVVDTVSPWLPAVEEIEEGEIFTQTRTRVVTTIHWEESSNGTRRNERSVTESYVEDQQNRGTLPVELPRAVKDALVELSRYHPDLTQRQQTLLKAELQAFL